LVSVDGNMIGVDDFDFYKSALLQYGDYVLANMIVPGAEVNQQQDQMDEAGKDGAAAGVSRPSEAMGGEEEGDESSDDEGDDIYEAFAVAQLRLEMQDALFSRLGTDMEQILGQRTG
jgi:hypothetical protein